LLQDTEVPVRSEEPEVPATVQYKPLVDVVDNPIFRSELKVENIKNPFLHDQVKQSGLNFINFLPTAFTLVDLESIKKLTTLQSFLRFWDL